MKGGKTPLGYTIIEVMIVLAVSGLIFLIAVNFINGKQEKTSFTAGVNETASQIQDVIEQVIDGHYSDIPLSCTYVGGVTQPSPSAAPGNTQGRNLPCVFLGKLIYFSYDTAASVNYEIFSLAGGRVDSSGNPITTPQAAGPVVINTPDLTVRKTTSQNLAIQKVTVNGGITNSSAIGFLQSPAVDASNNLANGTTTIGLYYFQNLGPGNLDPIGLIRLHSSWFQPAQNVDICLTDGTQYADITLGSQGGQLNVSITRDGTTKPPTC